MDHLSQSQDDSSRVNPSTGLTSADEQIIVTNQDGRKISIESSQVAVLEGTVDSEQKQLHIFLHNRKWQVLVPGDDTGEYIVCPQIWNSVEYDSKIEHFVGHLTFKSFILHPDTGYPVTAEGFGSFRRDNDGTLYGTDPWNDGEGKIDFPASDTSTVPEEDAAPVQPQIVDTFCFTREITAHVREDHGFRILRRENPTLEYLVDDHDQILSHPYRDIVVIAGLIDRGIQALAVGRNGDGKTVVPIPPEGDLEADGYPYFQSIIYDTKIQRFIGVNNSSIGSTDLTSADGQYCIISHHTGRPYPDALAERVTRIGSQAYICHRSRSPSVIVDTGSDQAVSRACFFPHDIIDVSRQETAVGLFQFATDKGHVMSHAFSQISDELDHRDLYDPTPYRLRIADAFDRQVILAEHPENGGMSTVQGLYGKSIRCLHPGILAIEDLSGGFRPVDHLDLNRFGNRSYSRFQFGPEGKLLGEWRPYRWRKPQWERIPYVGEHTEPPFIEIRPTGSVLPDILPGFLEFKYTVDSMKGDVRIVGYGRNTGTELYEKLAAISLPDNRYLVIIGFRDGNIHPLYFCEWDDNAGYTTTHIEGLSPPLKDFYFNTSFNQFVAGTDDGYQIVLPEQGMKPAHEGRFRFIWDDHQELHGRGLWPNGKEGQLIWKRVKLVSEHGSKTHTFRRQLSPYDSEWLSELRL